MQQSAIEVNAEKLPVDNFAITAHDGQASISLFMVKIYFKILKCVLFEKVHIYFKKYRQIYFRRIKKIFILKKRIV